MSTSPQGRCQQSQRFGRCGSIETTFEGVEGANHFPRTPSHLCHSTGLVSPSTMKSSNTRACLERNVSYLLTFTISSPPSFTHDPARIIASLGCPASLAGLRLHTTHTRRSERSAAGMNLRRPATTWEEQGVKWDDTE